ncbi:MAG TPA: hypothetical protein V6C76_03800 [Drouetiella sp.]
MSLEQGKAPKDTNHDNQLKQAGKDSGFEDPRQLADAASLKFSAESNSGDASRPKDKVAVSDAVYRPNEGGDGYVVKAQPSDYASYAKAVAHMPKDGIGSHAEINDTFAFYKEKFADNADHVAWLNKTQQAVGLQTLQA